MLKSLRQSWSRDAVGYRRGELEDGDGVATMVVTLIGGPAVVVGSVLVEDLSLDLGQILLVAPVGALLGALLVGSSAAMAAQTGANGTWLLRPAFGRGGSIPISLLRLLMVVVWAVVALQVAGEWAGASLAELGVDLAAPFWTGVVAVLGILLVLAGLVRTVKVVIRRPLFIGSVLLVGAVAWQLAKDSVGDLAGTGQGSFWSGVQLTVEAAVVFLPFVEALARRLHDDEVAMTSFSVGYAVPATLMFAAGAFLAGALGGLEAVSGIGTGTAGLAVVIAWVVVAEVDQAFSSFVGAGSEAIGIVRFGPAWLVGLVVVLGVGALAVSLPEMPIELASLAAALVLPAALIAAFDFHLAKDHHYTEADIYGSTEDFVNVTGLACWMMAVVIGQLLDPVGPAAWVGVVPETPLSGSDIPWRLITAVVAATVYFLVQRWGSTRRASVYEVRGVGAYGPQDEV